MKDISASPHIGEEAIRPFPAFASARPARRLPGFALALALLLAFALAGCATEKAQPDRVLEPLGQKALPELKPDSNPAKELTGTVAERVEAKGTLSEYTVFVLERTNAAAIVLFNKKGYSAGFSEWVGKSVTVTGESAEGRIGNANKKAKGFRVDTILQAH